MIELKNTPVCMSEYMFVCMNRLICIYTLPVAHTYKDKYMFHPPITLNTPILWSQVSTIHLCFTMVSGMC